MPTIHPTAIVDPRAELADDVEVHAYATIGRNVSVGAGSIIFSHSIIEGPSVIGAGCKIGPAAYIGLDPQHLEFLSRPDRPQTWATIGDRTIVREAPPFIGPPKPDAKTPPALATIACSWARPTSPTIAKSAIASPWPTASCSAAIAMSGNARSWAAGAPYTNSSASVGSPSFRATKPRRAISPLRRRAIWRA